MFREFNAKMIVWCLTKTRFPSRPCFVYGLWNVPLGKTWSLFVCLVRRTCKKKKKKNRRKWVLCKPMGTCGLIQGFVQDGSCTVFAGGSSGCIQVRKICSLFLSPLPGPTHCSFFRVKTSHCETKIHMPSWHSQLLAYNLHSWGPSKA